MTHMFNTPGNNIASQFGMPLYGISGMLPFTGNYFWVDETNGSDGNTGGPQDPYKTLAQAHTACQANNNDVVFLSGTAHTAVSIVWSKNKTHLIGLSPPSQNSRARIAITSSAVTTAVTPLVEVTAAGCIFQNIEVFNGVNANAAQVAWAEEGSQNYYKNCNFIGDGYLTAAAHAGNRSLTVASSENLFENCTIGGNTVLRATGNNATLSFASNPVTTFGAARNVFRSCIFQMYTSNTANIHVLAAAGNTIDRYVLFENCSFINAYNITSGVTLAVNFTVDVACGGLVLLQDCASVGATVYATTGPIWVQGSVPTGNSSGIAVAAT